MGGRAGAESAQGSGIFDPRTGRAILKGSDARAADRNCHTRRHRHRGLACSQELGDTYAEVLAEHRRLLRRHSGATAASRSHAAIGAPPSPAERTVGERFEPLDRLLKYALSALPVSPSPLERRDRFLVDG